MAIIDGKTAFERTLQMKLVRCKLLSNAGILSLSNEKKEKALKAMQNLLQYNEEYVEIIEEYINYIEKEMLSLKKENEYLKSDNITKELSSSNRETYCDDEYEDNHRDYDWWIDELEECGAFSGDE